MTAAGLPFKLRPQRIQVWDIEPGLQSLGLEHVDVMLMGGFNALPPQDLMERAQKSKEQGKVKMLALSTHKRASIPEIAKSKIFDIFQIRCNAAHRGAEKDIFPYLDPVTGPGVVAFTATRWGTLLDPKKMPPGEAPLRVSEFRR